MHMVAYDNLRPSLSPNCMASVRDLYARCTSDDQNVRPTFEEIVQILENHVRKETLMCVVRLSSQKSDIKVEWLLLLQNERQEDQVEEEDAVISAEELGVHHATNYLEQMIFYSIFF